MTKKKRVLGRDNTSIFVCNNELGDSRRSEWSAVLDIDESDINGSPGNKTIIKERITLSPKPHILARVGF
jgi:hypothetical protein